MRLQVRGTHDLSIMVSLGETELVVYNGKRRTCHTQHLSCSGEECTRFAGSKKSRMQMN